MHCADEIMRHKPGEYYNLYLSQADWWLQPSRKRSITFDIIKIVRYKISDPSKSSLRIATYIIIVHYEIRPVKYHL